MNDQAPTAQRSASAPRPQNPAPDPLLALQQSHVGLSNTLEQLMVFLQPLLSATASQAQAPSPVPAAQDGNDPFTLPRNLKLPVIEMFNGRKARGVTTWLGRARKILIMSNVPIHSPQAVHYVSSFLEDNALKWFEMMAANVSLDQRPHAGFQSFDAFAMSMTAALGEHFPAEKARDRLTTLKQRGSVVDYGSEFQRTLADIPDMDVGTVRYFYLRGLKDKLREMITGKFDDLASWDVIHLVACRHDQLSYVARPSLHTHIPMDLGNVNVTKDKAKSRTPRQASKPRPPLTQAERATLTEQGGCFYCRKAGHIATDCPEKKKHEAYLANHPTKN
jgi:hypothetical protein